MGDLSRDGTKLSFAMERASQLETFVALLKDPPEMLSPTMVSGSGWFSRDGKWLVYRRGRAFGPKGSQLYQFSILSS
jgi:hypothetical protein